MTGTPSPRILFLYPNRMQEELERVSAGTAPTERFYGLIELRRRGWTVDFLDSRFEGRFGRVARGLRPHGINLIDLKTAWAFRRYDLIVVKDAFSTPALLAAKAAGRPLIYLDSMFALPTRPWRRLAARVNLRGADRVVAYSKRQIALWAEALGLPPELFVFLPYTIDLDFYGPRHPGTSQEPPYVLSVGRDLGRDFGTLIDALDGTGLHLKLVTLPYLVPEAAGRKPWVQVLARVGYEELFGLYAGAAMVVIPLKRGITYLSGVRGMLEAMALGRPVVVSRTPGLEEYAAADEVFFVDPEDREVLRRTMTLVRDDPDRAAVQCHLAGQAVRTRYGMDSFVVGFERLLRSI